MELRGLSISELKKRLAAMEEVSEQTLAGLERDPRSGVRALAGEIRRRHEKSEAFREEQERMLELERSYHSRGYTRVAGVDEAGRGPLAGPVVAAAVIFPPECNYPPARDSKKLSPSRREELYKQIMERALAVGIGSASHQEIDERNIYQASLAAMYRALEDLSVQPDAVLIDGPMVLRIDLPQQAVNGGDATCLSLAAASIVAKVTRDRMMQELDLQYPGYGFARHKGYGTADHLRALKTLGPCPVHRRSFAVVAQSEKEFAVKSNLSEQCRFFLEGLKNSSNLEELERIGEDIRQIRESLTRDELEYLREIYRRRRKEFSSGAKQ